MASADVSGWDESERNGRRYFAVTFPGLMVSESGSFYTMKADYISPHDSYMNYIYGYSSKEELYEAVKNAPGSYYVEYTYDIDDDIAADPKDISERTETNAAEEETAAPETSASDAAAMEMAQETEYISCRTMWATDDINVRETPAMDKPVVALLHKGKPVTVIGEIRDWYKVSIPYTDDNGERQEFIGFVSKQFMTDSDPVG